MTKTGDPGGALPRPESASKLSLGKARVSKPTQSDRWLSLSEVIVAHMGGHFAH